MYVDKPANYWQLIRVTLDDNGNGCSGLGPQIVEIGIFRALPACQIPPRGGLLFNHLSISYYYSSIPLSVLTFSLE